MDQSWINAQQAMIHDEINFAFQPDRIGQNRAAWAANLTIRASLGVHDGAMLSSVTDGSVTSSSGFVSRVVLTPR